MSLVPPSAARTSQIAPLSTPRAQLVAVGGGAFVGGCRVRPSPPFVLSYPSRCSPIPPREQLLAAVCRGAALAAVVGAVLVVVVVVLAFVVPIPPSFR